MKNFVLGFHLASCSPSCNSGCSNLSLFLRPMGMRHFRCLHGFFCANYVLFYGSLHSQNCIRLMSNPKTVCLWWHKMSSTIMDVSYKRNTMNCWPKFVTSAKCLCVQTCFTVKNVGFVPKDMPITAVPLAFAYVTKTRNILSRVRFILGSKLLCFPWPIQHLNKRITKRMIYVSKIVQRKQDKLPLSK